MQIPCPYCDRKFPIEAALNDKAAREVVAIALKMPPPLGDLILRYISLFRPSKTALNWGRAGRLMGELLEQMQSGEVKRDGRAWKAPVDVWKAGLECVLDKKATLTLPLTSHGLLTVIVADLAGKHAGVREKQQEEDRQHRPTRNEGPEPAGDVAGRAFNKKKHEEHVAKLRRDTGH